MTISHLTSSGYVPNQPVLNVPVFTNDRGEAIHLNWTIEESRITPVDNYTLFWRIEREGDDEEGSGDDEEGSGRRQNNENNTQTTDKSYNLTDYISEAVYTFWVIAENNAGRSQISNERIFEVLSTERKRSGLDVWVIALIGSIILLCICCILCCICLFCYLAARPKRKRKNNAGMLLLFFMACRAIPMIAFLRIRCMFIYNYI